MVDSREEVIDDKCGINVLPGIIGGDGGESGQLKEAFEAEKTSFPPSTVIKRADVFDGIPFYVGECSEQNFCFACRQVDPDQAILKGLARMKRDTKRSECSFRTRAKRFIHKGLPLFGGHKCFDYRGIGECQAY